MKIKKILRNINIVHCVALVIILMMAMTAIMYNDMYSATLKNARCTADIVWLFLDPDDMLRYAQTGEADDLYAQTADALTQTKMALDDCENLYVIYPKEDAPYYLFVAYNDEEWEEYNMNYLDEDLMVADDWDNMPQARELYLSGEKEEKLDMLFISDYGPRMCYYLPVYTDDGEMAGIIGVDYRLDDFFVSLIGTMFIIVLCIILVAFLLSIIEYKVINNRIVKPVQLVEETARAFANSEHNGESDKYLLPESKDSVNEVDLLCSAMNKMIKDTDEYIRNIGNITRERERIDAELSVATTIQASSLPSEFPPFPEKKDFDIYATMTPAKEVGGDFYDFFLLDDSHLALVIADVSGKGVGAALFMMISKILINSQAQITTSPAEILERVNNILCDRNEAGMFVTVWLGILDLTTGLLKASNGGHEYPAIRKGDGKFQLFKDVHGFVLGGMDGMKYHEYEIQLEKGDALFLYTDGVAEASNAAEEFYGTDRMLEALNMEPCCEVEKRLANVKGHMDAFVKDAEQFDDITMMTLEYHGR